MIYFVQQGEKKFFNDLIYKIKNNVKIVNYNIRNVNYNIVDFNKTKKSFFMEIVKDRNNHVFIEDSLKETYLNEYNDEIVINNNSYYYFEKSINYIIKYIKQNKKLSFVYSKNLENIILKSLSLFNSIDIISSSCEADDFCEFVLNEYGAILNSKNFDDVIDNNIIINDKKDINIKGKNNKILSLYDLEIKNNIVITDFDITLKKIYLDNKPEFLTEKQFYTILNSYSNFDDEVKTNLFKCKINNKTKKINDIFDII